METLKPLATLLEPDARQPSFSVFDPELRAFRPFTLEDLYSRVSQIELHSGVPETVRSHFATALNLVAYSWHFYPFNVTAQFMGYVSVEYALRTRYPEKPVAPFKRLVERAVREGLIQDKGFSHYRDPELNQSPPELQSLMIEPPANAYGLALIESIPFLRNSLAHGTSMLHMHGVKSVQMCADFINQLFERPPRDGS